MFRLQNELKVQLQKDLCKAAGDGRVEDVKRYLKQGVDVNATDCFETPLTCALYAGHEEVVKLLTSKGAKFNDGLLCGAARNGQLKIVDLLLQNGVDVNHRDRDGRTPLSYGLQGAHIEVVKLLLSNGAKYDSDVLIFAARYGQLEMVDLCLQNGLNVNRGDSWDRTPLSHALEGGHNEVVKLLLSKGAKVEGNPADYIASTKLKSTLRNFKQTKKNTIAALQKCITKAKNQKGRVKVRFLKLLLTGSGAAGKTSFSNLLMKNKFVGFHHSTNIVQTKHAVSVRKAVVVGLNQCDDQNIVWLEMDDDSQMSHLRQILLSLDISSLQKTLIPIQPTPSSQSPILQPKNISSKSQTASQENIVHEPYVDKQYVIPKQRTSATQRLSGLFQGSVKSEKMASFQSLVQNSVNSNLFQHDFHHNGDVLNIISLLDTGGQPEYIHLLPTVNIHPMVNFVVHDLSKSLNDQVLVEYSDHGKLIFEPYHLKYSNFDMIKFLMSNINDSLERTSSQVPQLVTIPGKNNNTYLCCVGTHADKVSPETLQNTDSQLTAMVEKLDCKAALWENKHGGVLYPVDNTTSGNDKIEDPTAKFIRNKIDKLATDKDTYELPITWMLFELEIRHVCSNSGKGYILLDDCYSIAKQTNLISSTGEVRNALMYHHLLGVLLYYPSVPGLCEYVIIDHQWLFDRISSIVCFTFKYSSNKVAANKLKYNGFLTKDIFQELHWNEELKEEYLVSLLAEMKIIAPIQNEDGEGEDYFIPYILPTYVTDQPLCSDILSQYGYLQGEPLLIQFVSNLLPRGFFCCLAVQMLQQLPKGWGQLFTQNDTRHTYSNLITIRLQSAYCLSLIDKLCYLEVQIRHHKESYYHEHPIHITVQGFIASALEIVCEQLTFNHGRIQYGFHCQCGEHDNEHVAVLTTLTPPFDYALCRQGNVTATELKNGHTVWLAEVPIKIIPIGESAYSIFSGNWNPEAAKKVYKNLYLKLMRSLPMNDIIFLKLLNDQNLLPGDLQEQIQSKATTAERTAWFLDHAIEPSLNVDKVAPLCKLLTVMSDNTDLKSDLLKQLAAEIAQELDKETSLITMKRKDCSSTETTSTVPGAIDNLPTTSGSENQTELLNRKPEMFDLNKIVISKIMNEWEYIAEAFRYDVPTIATIKERGYGDAKQCCRELFKDWLTTDHGAKVGPKVWSTLFDILKAVDEISDDVTKDIVTKVKQLKCD